MNSTDSSERMKFNSVEELEALETLVLWGHLHYILDMSNGMQLYWVERFLGKTSIICMKLILTETVMGT